MDSHCCITVAWPSECMVLVEVWVMIVTEVKQFNIMLETDKCQLYVQHVPSFKCLCIY